MRVNIYEEEITDRVELVTKGARTGLMFYLYLPVTDKDGQQRRGPFMHRPGDDDSSGVTFWGKKDDLRKLLEIAISKLG